MITMIVRMLDLPIVSGNPFSDIDESMWSEPFISTAYQNDLVAGRSDGSYDPKALVTSEELFIMLENVEKTIGKGGLTSLDGYEVKVNQVYLQLRDQFTELVSRKNAVEVLIRFSDRTVDQDYIIAAMKNNEIVSFSDLTRYYPSVYAAAVEHWVVVDEDGRWTRHMFDDELMMSSEQMSS